MDGKDYKPDVLRELREQQDWSQEYVAKRLKKARATISRAETGKVASYKLLSSLAKLYKRSVVEILR